MDIRKLFGRNLRFHRMAAGTSQEALAAKMGVDRAHVSSMERGHQNVTLLTLWLASVALSIKPAVLLDESGVENLTNPEEKVPRRPRNRPSG